MSKPTSVEAYLDAMPEDRRVALAAVRKVIRKHLPKGYQEGLQYGMIGYFVPHASYPSGYHANPKEPLPFLHLASQKSHMSLYLMCVYGDPKLMAWLVSAYKKLGMKLDMGKACVRFKNLTELPLPVIGELISKVPVTTYIKRYEAAIAGAKRSPKVSKAEGKTARKTKSMGETRRSRAAGTPRAKKPIARRKRPAPRTRGTG